MLEATLPIYDRSDPILYSAGGATQEVAVEKLILPQGISSDRGGFEISVGTSPLRSLRDGLRYLFAYPYGCAEQRVSALFGLWQLTEILKGFEGSEGKLPSALEKVYSEFFPSTVKMVDTAEIKKSLEQGLSGLYVFQQAVGGFAFWKEDSFPPFLSADMARAFGLFWQAGREGGCRFRNASANI